MRCAFASTPGLAEVGFEDRLQGPVSEHCHHTVFAYHLAVVVDDELQGVTEVVRGCDTPEYAHLPLLLETDGRKLAKSRHAVPLDTDRAAPTLWEALDWLRQDPPAELAGASVREIWAWALPNWRPNRLAGCRELRLP